MDKGELRAVKLLELLKAGGNVDLQTVVASLSVSEATARRSLAKLETEGKIIRTHGGARLAPELSYDYSYRVSANVRSAAKTAVGTAAAKLVGSNEKIFLDSGTTIMRFAEALALRVRGGELKNITVVTNALGFAESLADCCETLLTGGKIRLERRDVCGPETERSIAKYRFDKAFFGVDAIDVQSGCMTTDDDTAKLCELALERSAHSYVLADSSKFGRSSFVAYAALERFEAIITDHGISPFWVEELRRRQLRLEIVGAT